MKHICLIALLFLASCRTTSEEIECWENQDACEKTILNYQMQLDGLQKEINRLKAEQRAQRELIEQFTLYR